MSYCLFVIAMHLNENNVNDVVIIYASVLHITVKGVRFKPNIVHGCNVKSS
jgi:hypothetical protein